MPDRTEFERTSDLPAVDGAQTESFYAAPGSAEAPAPGWGNPTWGAPQHAAPPHVAAHEAGPPTAVDNAAVPPPVGYAGPNDDEPFVPAPRYRMARFTKVLVCACLVLAGALGGAAIQRAVDAGNGATRGNLSQFTGQGTGAGQNGTGSGGQGTFGGRNRSSQGAGTGTGGATPGASAPASAGN